MPNVSNHVRSAPLYAQLYYEDWKAGRQLTLAQGNVARIQPGDILLFACLRNECFRMPFFVDYYRKLGVRHFLFVDNGSTDDFMLWARQHADVSVWHTTASYKKSNFGMLWLNDLLRRFGTGHWNVVVDPDEFIVYPHHETRSLGALAAFLDEEKRACMHALTLDAYSDRRISDTVLEDGQNPLEVCPFIDRDGYIGISGWGNGTWIRGGPRLRSQFRDCPHEAPALNKIPFIKWQRHFHYRNSTHDAYPLRLNKAHPPHSCSITGAILHFKFLASLEQKAAEELMRREHYAGGREYERYAEHRGIELYRPGISIRYENSRQLIDLGLMSAGTWF